MHFSVWQKKRARKWAIYLLTLIVFLFLLARDSGVIRDRIIGHLYGITIKNSPPMPLVAAQKEYVCSANEVTLSPSGNYAIFERGERKTNIMASSGTAMQVVDLVCLKNNNPMENCAVHLAGFDGMRPFAWLRDESAIFAMENETNLIKIALSPVGSMNSPRIVERVKFDSFSAIRSLTKSGVTDDSSAKINVDRLNELNREVFERVRKNDTVVGISLMADGKVGVFARTEDLQSVIYDDWRRFEQGTKEMVIHSSVLAPAPGGESEKLLVLGTGFATQSDGFEIANSNASYASKPLLSPQDGQWLGWFDLKDLRLSQNLINGNAAENEVKTILKDPSQTISGLSISDSGDFAIISRDSFENKLITIGDREGKFAIDCPNLYPIAFGSLENSLEDRAFKAAVDVVSLGTSEWPLYGISLVQPNPHGLAVVFGGGPGNSGLNQLRTNSSAHMYRRLGYNVLIVDYSSSPVYGLRVAERIRLLGLNALTRDSDLVARYILEKHPEEKNIVVHGESFGGLPAVSLSASISGPNNLVLMAPFLKYLKPEEWVFDAKGASNSARSNYQHAWDKAVMGVDSKDSNEFEIQLRKFVERKNPESRIFVAFGDADVMSKKEHLPNSWDEGLETQVFSGNHEMLSLNPALWPAVAEWLGLAK